MKEATTRLYSNSNRPRIISDDFPHCSQNVSSYHGQSDCFENEGNLESPPIKDLDEKKKRRHRPRGCRGRGSRRNRSMRRAAAQAAAAVSRQDVAFTESLEEQNQQAKLATIPCEESRETNETSETFKVNQATKMQFTISESNDFHSGISAQRTFKMQVEEELALHRSAKAYRSEEAVAKSTVIDRRRHFVSKRDDSGIISASSSASGRSLAIVSSSSSSERSIVFAVSNSFEVIDGKDHLAALPQPSEQINQELAPRQTSAQTEHRKTPGKTVRKSDESIDACPNISKTRKHGYAVGGGSSGSLFSTSPKSFLRGEQKKLRTNERKEMDQILSELMGPQERSNMQELTDEATTFIETPRPYCWF